MPVGQHGTHRGSGFGAGPRTGRGDNHGRRGRAIAGALASALLVAGLAAGIAAGPAFAQSAEESPQANPLVQRNVPAEATAENAVVARDRALISGQRIAYDRMAEALGLPRGASDSQIQSQVASLVIESERITPRGYNARITVNFRSPSGGSAASAPFVPDVQAGGAQSQGGPAVASVEAVARYRSLPEYIEITRRLTASPSVARYDVVAISGEAARLRLALRSPPPVAAAEMNEGGLLLGQDPQAAMPGAANGEGWRLGLAGWR